MSDTDDWDGPSCWDCGESYDRADLQPHPVHIDHDDEPGYDRVDVPLCRRCRNARLPTYDCETCGSEYTAPEDAYTCCNDREVRQP